MKEKKVKLSIIIVNWNTKEITLDCLKSVYQQTQKINFEVIVVDNNSQDESVKAIKKQYPQVELIQNKSNVGFAKGNNIGIQKAKGEYILLLNSDTIVLDHALEQMVEYMDKHPDVGVCTPQLVGRDGSLQHSTARLPSLYHYFNEYLLHRLSAWYPSESYKKNMEVESIIGACFLVRRSIIDQVGPLPEYYFMYSEDVDWSYRIKTAGWKLIYLAKPKVIHIGGESSKRNKKAMDEELVKSRIIYFQKYHSPLETVMLRGIISASRGRTALKRILTHS